MVPERPVNAYSNPRSDDDFDDLLGFAQIGYKATKDGRLTPVNQKAQDQASRFFDEQIANSPKP